MLCLSACEPTAQITQPVDWQDSKSPRLILNLTSAEIAVKPAIRARIVNRYDMSDTYAVTVRQDSKQENQYQLEFDQPESGNYRMIADMRYRPTIGGIYLAARNKRIYYDFQVHKNLPAFCFNFDQKEKDIQGWESHGVFVDNKPTPFKAAPCPGLFFVHNDWPHALHKTTRGGSVFVPISNECFPQSSHQQSQLTHWNFSLQSPELSQLEHWQGLASISIRVISTATPIRIEPEVHYTANASSTQMLSTPRQMYVVSGQGWSELNYPVNLNKGALIKRLELHVSGIPEQTVDNQVRLIFFDGICPQAQHMTAQTATTN